MENETGFDNSSLEKGVNFLKPSVNAMFNGKESRYALAMGVAKRAREITVEFQDTVFESVKGKKPLKVAEKDFKSGKYYILQPDLKN